MESRNVAKRRKKNEVPNAPEWENVFRILRVGQTEFPKLAGITPSNFWSVAKGLPAGEDMLEKINAFLQSKTCECCAQYWENKNERSAGETTETKKPPGVKNWGRVVSRKR